jgi:transcriptional regulator with XRE-family HTH domain
MGRGKGTGKGGNKPKGTTKLVQPHARELRMTLAQNLRAAIDAEWPPKPSQPENSDGIARLAAGAGCSVSTVQRILAGEVSPRVDQIADFAAALGVRPMQLLDRRFNAQGRESRDSEVDPGRMLQRPRG